MKEILLGSKYPTVKQDYLEYLTNELLTEGILFTKSKDSDNKYLFILGVDKQDYTYTHNWDKFAVFKIGDLKIKALNGINFGSNFPGTFRTINPDTLIYHECMIFFETIKCDRQQWVSNHKLVNTVNDLYDINSVIPLVHKLIDYAEK